MGMLAKAEPLLKQALQINEKALGPEHPDTASCLDSLAQLYHHLGDYAKAEPLYQRALGIFDKTLGLNHPRTAISLSNLTILELDLADTPKHALWR